MVPASYVDLGPRMWIIVSQTHLAPLPLLILLLKGGGRGALLTGPMVSSFWISSFSSFLLKVFLSPSLPEYLWKMATRRPMAWSRGHAMAGHWAQSWEQKGWSVPKGLPTHPHSHSPKALSPPASVAPSGVSPGLEGEGEADLKAQGREVVKEQTGRQLRASLQGLQKLGGMRGAARIGR